MFSHTSLTRLLFRRSRRPDVRHLLESHFWGLTRYRIGPRFLGLDYAGNVIFYPAYRKQGFGGWTSVTLGAPGSTSTKFLSSDTSAVNVLEDGYPMHYKASRLLQAFVTEERRKWKADIAQQTAAAELKKKQAAADPSTPAKEKDEDANLNVELADDVAGLSSDQHFRDTLAIQCSNPRFFSRHLRISRLATFLYKLLYFYLWGVLVSMAIECYMLFREWVNEPAREGLKNIEGHVLHVPRLIFSSCVHGIAWLVRAGQPLLDPTLKFLAENFPQINWSAAYAEKIASRADKLAENAHPSSSSKPALRSKQNVKSMTSEERRTWWTRALLMLIALFSLLCVL